jgi:hypothetical protein
MEIFSEADRKALYSRQGLMTDYLLKLKPRSYPENDKGNYLTPSIVNKCDPGRSFYLTLHKEVIARIHEPGTSQALSLPRLVKAAQNRELTNRTTLRNPCSE